MTQSKIEKLRKELIEKNGDRALIHIVDKKTNAVIVTLRISNIIIRNNADFKEVERILKEGNPRTRRVDMSEIQNGWKGGTQ